jgi:hypothetical protein
MVNMVATGNIPNDKGILIVNTDATIDHFEFSGAKGASGNDAGIRYQGGALTLTNSYFHDNQNGLLAAPSATGTITIDNSEFANNGIGDGYTHNLYVNSIAKLTITDSYFHDAVVGHEIKSRAAETVITNTRIIDNNSTSSYSIDMPNGGKATLSGNVIQQGPNGDNPNIIAYGEEGLTHSVNALRHDRQHRAQRHGQGDAAVRRQRHGRHVDGTKGVGDQRQPDDLQHGGEGDQHHAPVRQPTLDASHPWTTSSPTPTPTLHLPTPRAHADSDAHAHARALTTGIDWTGGSANDIKSRAALAPISSRAVRGLTSCRAWRATTSCRAARAPTC